MTTEGTVMWMTLVSVISHVSDFKANNEVRPSKAALNLAKGKPHH